MEAIFLKLLNMSAAASWLILAVVILRACLKKAPRGMICLLWALVGIRLICPFSIESMLSVIPSAEVLSPAAVQYEARPELATGISALDHSINPYFSQFFAAGPVNSVNPLEVWTVVGSMIWLTGMIGMLIYAAVSYGRVYKMTREAALLRDNVWQCDGAQSPFVRGLLAPRIILPSGMEAGSMGSVIAHERAHIRRGDHVWKPLGFLILALHWMNPLCWLAYVLMCRDIELACDEKVIRSLDIAGKKAYSRALLDVSGPRRRANVLPLAFGGVGVKKRVKHVLRYKRPKVGTACLMLVACAALAVCFLTNPKPAGEAEGLRAFLGDFEETAALEEAIRRAVLDWNRGKYLPGEFACGSHIVFLTEESETLTTVCASVLYEEFSFADGRLEAVSGGAGPVQLIFERDEEGGYRLKEYWEPGDGNRYARDIAARFPAKVAAELADTQRTILPLTQACYAQAIACGGIDVGRAIESLLQIIESEPTRSAGPRDYIAAHPIEYRELTYYGDSARSYCLAELQKGEHTALRGEILMQLLNDLTPKKTT